MERVTVAPLYRLTARYFSWLPFGVLVLLCLCSEVTEVGGACPSDVRMAAHACFTEFSREYQNVKHSPKLLCCGVDVETLRAFCSSYMRAASCIEDLMAQCEDPTAVEHALTNLQGARPALHALCSDDTLIERYARHQSCITQAGPITHQCIRRYLNTSDNVRLLANVQTQESTEFCRAVRHMLACVQRNVGQQCGERAAQLAAVLVQPMIRYSTACDYVMPQPPSPTPILDQPYTERTRPFPSSQGGSQQHGSRHVYDSTSASASSRFRSTLMFIFWTSAMKILIQLS